MMTKTLQVGFATVILGFVATGAAQAVMGAPTILARVDTDHDKTLSLDEVRSAAGRVYDLIKSKNGKVTMLQLSGRMMPEDFKGVKDGLVTPDKTPISRDDYLALASKFYDEANTKTRTGAAEGSGTLGLEQLGSPSGKKLIGLLQ